jgi:hypothetical protein
MTDITNMLHVGFIRKLYTFSVSVIALFQLKHIGFSDGGEWSLFLRTECPDALLAYAVAQHYQVLLHVISIGGDVTEEIKFYPSPHAQSDEERHVYIAYLADDSFLNLLPLNTSGERFTKHFLIHDLCF